ncbi:MAG: molecular chaperone, partial [Dehalococcoidia bacterium]
MSRAEAPAQTEELETARARSLMYRFLSRAVSYPTEDQQLEIRTHLRPALAALETGVPEFDSALTAVLEASLYPLDELQRAHVAVLGHTVSPDCPDYETSYSATDIFMQTQAMADVAGFYVAHGLQVGGARRERPDHIATELEFMSFLALKEAYALEHLGADELGL